MKKIKVLAGGRFNILHPGHIYFLRKAKSLGDYLVVVVANDRTVRREGKDLIFPQAVRKKTVESLRFVDRAVIGHGTDILKTVEKIKPDIIALGYDQNLKEKELEKRLKERGFFCRIVRIQKLKNYSTRNIMGKIKTRIR